MVSSSTKTPELAEAVPEPIQIPEEPRRSHNFFSGKALQLTALIILIVGVFGTVVFAELKQITSSHASGTVTLSVDKNPQVDLAGRKITFFVRLTSSGDNPPISFPFSNHPAVAAVKVRVDTKFSGQLPAIGTFSDILSFTPHMPFAFPLASNNPNGVLPFSTQHPTITISPLPTCHPFPRGIAQGLTTTPTPPCANPPHESAPSANGAGRIDDKLQQLDKNVLYFSVGDQYTKTVNTSVVLGDLAITIPLPFGFDPKKPLDTATMIRFKNAVVKISFGSDTKVYKLSGNPKEPFIQTPFIAQDATFTLQDIINGILPSGGPTPKATPTGISHLSPTPAPTGGIKSSVDIVTILECLDLKKPISDPTSNFFSATCKKHADRAKADLNGDGWINQVDINLYYRQ